MLPPVQLPAGACSSCELGKGIQALSATALPGTGFTRIELSQAFDDTGCSDAGATNVNVDGMLWSGMKYSCITVGGCCSVAVAAVFSQRVQSIARSCSRSACCMHVDACVAVGEQQHSCCLWLSSCSVDWHSHFSACLPACCALQPTCGDANLQAAGDQPYNCSAAPGPLSYVYNPAAADSTTVTPQSCCLVSHASQQPVA
jgi:hypothetical protein